MAGIKAMYVEMYNQLSLLLFSGFAGAMSRAILAPETRWRRRLVQGIAGALSAIFLGGLVAMLIENLIIGEFSPFAWLAAGYLMGYGGEAGVKALQNRLMK